MSKQRINVWVKEPGKKPEKKEVEHSLKSFQELVGGYVEFVNAGDGDAIFVDEDGLLKDLPYNCTLFLPFGSHRLYGTVVLLGLDGIEFVSAKHTLTSHGEKEERCYIE